MPDRSIAPAKKMLFYGIMIAGVLVLCELITRAYYYQQLARHPLALVQLVKDVKKRAGALASGDTARRRVEKAEEMLRPGLPIGESDEIGAEQSEANKAVFKPWVEFTFRDFHGTYLNVTDHIRRSVPDRSDSSTKDPFRIVFLGGSTLYGFNLRDDETIPSSFVRAYRQTRPKGRPIEVINLGMPFYYSYQELIQLADLLFRNEKPDMVVMLDGLNDCIAANDAYNRVPAFAIGKLDTYRPGDAADEGKQLQDVRGLPPGLPVDSACRAVCGRYIDNIRHAHDLAGLYHIPLYCFWQPVPYYHYPNRPRDPICSQARSESFERIYPLVRQEGAALPYFFFLGDMLLDEKGLPFVDQIHYSPRFSRAVAEKMLSLIPL